MLFWLPFLRSGNYIKGGHSLSISDVMVIQRNKHTEAYYADSIRYIRMPGFISQRKEYAEKLYKRQELLVNE